MGVWLPVTVELAAAYHGRVLSVLTVPDPAAQINSLEGLNASGLTVYARYDDLNPENTLVKMLKNKVQYSFADLAVTARLVAEHRSTAAIFDSQHMPAMTADTLVKLHFFRVPGARMLRSIVETTKGSPMEMTIRKLMGRLRAGGILTGADGSRNSGHLGCDVDASALTRQHLLPAFLLLAVGLVAATSVCTAEMLASYGSYPPTTTSPRNDPEAIVRSRANVFCFL
ncbi:hypothetical protein ONE63_007348 [Megalurothrips usitatus]|uniref:Uncharacterized protein n=1 Tax=Megalurothrips usitatus TaxID=439358 RepID=A0AAV7XY85_9NEOP|nr:hypothetical protein ONE63_007348 [Megalurothrips usitatus]